MVTIPKPSYKNFSIKEGKFEVPLCTEYTMEDMSYLDTPQAKPIFEKQADIIIEKQSKGIIDIGCRHGPVNTILHEKGYTEYLYMGFDTSPEPIEMAKNQWYNFPNVEYRHTNWNNIKDITVDFNVDQVIWSGVLIYNPNNHKELFDKSYEIFTMYKDKLNPEEIVISKSNRDIGSLINFLVKDIEMNELRVQNGIKKIQNILND